MGCLVLAINFQSLFALGETFRYKVGPLCFAVCLAAPSQELGRLPELGGELFFLVGVAARGLQDANNLEHFAPKADALRQSLVHLLFGHTQLGPDLARTLRRRLDEFSDNMAQ